MNNWRATIGYMLPSSCLVYEHEFQLITASLPGVIGVPARLLITACDRTGLEHMNTQIDLAARQLATCDPDLVMYMCTSGSFMKGNQGENAIRTRITGLTRRPAATTAQSVLAALHHLGLRRVVMLTPYNEDLTKAEVRWLHKNGVEVIDYLGRDIPDNLDRGRQYPETSYHLARRLRHADADGILLSCANVRTIEIIEQLERDTGKPVISSSQATTWFALRQCGITDVLPGFGRLFANTQPAVAKTRGSGRKTKVP